MGANRVWSPVCKQGSGGCKIDLFRNKSGPQVGVDIGYWRVSHQEQPHLGCDEIQGQQLGASHSCHMFGGFLGGAGGSVKGFLRVIALGRVPSAMW